MLENSKTIALQYLIGNRGCMVLVYGAGIDMQLHPIGLDEEEAAVFGVPSGVLTAQSLGKLLADENQNGILQKIGMPGNVPESGVPDRQTLDRLALLWKILVPKEQLRDKILDRQSCDSLLILPDGFLSRLPFEMLLVEQDAASPQYLLDRGPAVLYAPSASMYHHLQNRNRNKIETKNVLTLGNPVYDTAPIATDTDLSRRFARFGALKPLPWTEKETRWIEESCKKADVPVERLDGKTATEKQFRDCCAGRRLVHLACHGIADDLFGNLFGCLALTVGNASDPKDDGYLTVAEMFALDLNGCDLAILSACDTNLGPNQYDEGTWSMGRGMLVSGAKRIVTTDWQVADDASAHLVYNFFDRICLENTNYARALREAKQTIRSNRDHLQWQHPYYWAPFVLLGPN